MMKKAKIVLSHFLAFLVGACGIAVYFFLKISALKEAAGLASIALVPAAAVYIIAFGIVCAVSCAIFILFTHVRKRKVH